MNDNNPDMAQKVAAVEQMNASQSLEEEREKRAAEANKPADLGLTSRQTGELLVDMFGQMSFKGADLEAVAELGGICKDIAEGRRAIVKTQTN